MAAPRTPARPDGSLNRRGSAVVAVVPALRRRWRTAAVVAALTGVAAGGALATQPATYRAEALLTVMPPLGQGIRTEVVAETVRDAVRSPEAAEAASAATSGAISRDSARDRTRATADPEGWANVTAAYEGRTAEDAERLAAASLPAAVRIAEQRLIPGSRLVLVDRASEALRVDRPEGLLFLGIAGLAAGAGLLAATAREVGGRRRGTARTAAA
jgi:uncharacterized protein involved in exopolysaccharide biosynthesis